MKAAPGVKITVLDFSTIFITPFQLPKPTDSDCGLGIMIYIITHALNISGEDIDLDL